MVMRFKMHHKTISTWTLRDICGGLVKNEDLNINQLNYDVMINNLIKKI